MAGIGPQLPPHLLKSKLTDDNDKEKIGPCLPCDIGPRFPSSSSNLKNNLKETSVEIEDSNNYGPSLPPGFGQKTTRQRVIGPAIPQNLSSQDEIIDSDEDEIVGPCLPSAENPGLVKSIEEEYEERAKAMKNKLTGKPDDGKLQRENWMLELPPGLSKNFGLGPRTFRSKAPELGDRSVWTDTPADKEQKTKERQESAMKAAGEKRKAVETKKMKEPPTKEELEMKERVEEYNKATRPKSLLELHQDKRKKMEPEMPSGRRPFDRDRDLNLKRSDPKATAKFITDATGLNSKFSKGNFEKKFL